MTKMSAQFSSEYKALLAKMVFRVWSVVDKGWNNIINFLYYNWYNQVFDGSIKEIEDYNINKVTRTTIYRLSWHEVFLVYFNFIPIDSVRVTEFIDPKPGHIYHITCWNGKKYLTKQDFNVKEVMSLASKSKNTNRFLTCILGGKDITSFMNTRRSSFTDKEKITVIELIVVCFLDNLIKMTELFAIVNRATSSLAPELYVMFDDDDMTEQIYKEIVLIK